LGAIKIAVKYGKGTSAEQRAKIEAKYHLTQTREIPVLRVVGYEAEESLVERIKKEEGVEYVERENTYKAV
jgi:hypothetical protein